MSTNSLDSYLQLLLRDLNSLVPFTPPSMHQHVSSPAHQQAPHQCKNRHACWLQWALAIAHLFPFVCCGVATSPPPLICHTAHPEGGAWPQSTPPNHQVLGGSVAISCYLCLVPPVVSNRAKMARCGHQGGTEALLAPTATMSGLPHTAVAGEP